MSEKTVAQKLFIKPGQRVGFINTPKNAMELLGGFPDGVILVDEAAAGVASQVDCILLFAHNQSDLERYLPQARSAVNPKGMIWVAYHKGTSRVKTDINRDIIWAYARSQNMDGVAMVSVNEDWAAMRLKITAPGI